MPENHTARSSGIIESRDFFYTVPMNDYFFGRDKRMGVLQVLFIICHVTFAFYYIFKLATHRLSYIFSSTWNVYDLGLLVLFTVSLYFDILFLVNITHALACLSVPQEDIFKELIGFIGIQRTRINLQAFITTAVLIRLLRFLPHFSNLFANLLNVFYRSVQNSIAFLVLFFMIFMSFVMYATFHYGDELYEVGHPCSKSIAPFCFAVPHLSSRCVHAHSVHTRSIPIRPCLSSLSDLDAGTPV